jgi:photosystem II stability/assembly factor-like uncharacterized protein
MKSARFGSRLLLALLSIAPALAASKPSPSPAAEPFANLEYRAIGPAAGGRVARVTGVPGDPHTFYAATAAGGVWKSSDGGVEWTPLTDELPVSSFGSIAVAATDTQVVYAGSGEANIRGNVGAGAGIFKSTDGGKHWEHVWKQSGQIGTIVVHPRDPDTAYAAVLGHAFGPNPERGVYRTRDGGRNWQRVLFQDDNTGASDVELDPSNPRVVFAGFWQARRRPWEMTSGGPGSGLWRSADGGDTWERLTGKGLPEGIWGKVGVRVAPSDSRRVYALIEAEEGGLFRSDDGGATWQRVNPSHGLRQRAWYYTCLTVDPQNPDIVWFPQVPLLKTVDGGRTVVPVKGGGWDYHDIWIAPDDRTRMIAGSDAGVSLSTNGGETWRRPPLPISQFYHLTADTNRPYRVMGSLQDYGTLSGPSDSLHSSGITLGDWHSVGGGEAGHVVADPHDPDIVYAGEYLGYFSRYDHRERSARNVSAYPENGSGHGVGDLRFRFQWTAPAFVSRHERGVVYHGANVLFRSADGGQSWTAVSPDLTRDDKSKQQWSGGPITGDNTGVEFYGTIFALAESPLVAGLIWAGSDDGLVHLTRDGGKTWIPRTPQGFPEWATVANIEASRYDAGTAYVVVDAHRLDDPRPYLFQTTDYGATWRSLSAGLDAGTYLHVVREDLVVRDLLYLGSERGVSYSRNAGKSWDSLQLNLPTVAVHDLALAEDDLVVGTTGRSAWILDDITPIRQWRATSAQETVHLFPPQPAARVAERGSAAAAGFANPPRGAVLHYWLQKEHAGELRLEISDAKGQLVRTLTSTPKKPLIPAGHPDASPDAKEPKGDLPTGAGLHRVEWDLRHEPPTLIQNAAIDWGDPENGPLVSPGTYSLRLLVADPALGSGAAGRTATLVVGPGLGSRVPLADLESQAQFAQQVSAAITRTSRAVESIRSLRTQLVTRLAAVPRTAATQVLRDTVDAVLPKLDALEAKLHNPKAEISYDILAQRGGAQLYSRLSPLFSFVKDGDGAPTQGMREVLAGQVAELAAHEAALAAMVRDDLSRVNGLAREIGLEWISVAHNAGGEPPARP